MTEDNFQNIESDLTGEVAISACHGDIGHKTAC